MTQVICHGIGRRKESVAKVKIMEGTGKILVNKKDLADYFMKPTLELVIKQPLIKVNSVNRFDVITEVKGGRITEQAGALRQAIARALVEVNEEFKPILYRAGFLKGDSNPRMYKRKKYGLAGRRKKAWYSKEII